MATASATPFALTYDGLIDAATNGYYWILGTNRTLYWSLSNGFGTETWTDPSAAAAAVGQVFATFSQYANINFRYVGHYNSPLGAGRVSDINISLDSANRFFSSNSTWAIGMFPEAGYNQAIYAGAAGDIYINLNSDVNRLTSYAPGTEGFLLFMHEIGHALGLKHPHDSGGTGRPTLAALGLEGLDADWFSVMSYNDDNDWNAFAWDPETPMIMDVLALQYLYGKNMQASAGNNIYTPSATNTYSTIWDAGGSDTVDVSSSNQAWSIYLPEIQLSSLVDTKVGVAYLSAETALDSPHTFYWLAGDIENARGSQNGDILEGNSLDNRLEGFFGNDSIDGGAGHDIAHYNLERSNYSIMKTTEGYRVASSREGIDSLVNIEQLYFSDMSINLQYNDPVQQLYVAYFGRAADSVGLANFTRALAAAGAPDNIQGLTSAYQSNATVRSLIDAFGTSAESGRLYTGDTTAFVTAIFQNVLARAPQDAGMAFWRNAIDSGALTKGNAALSIMAGALANTTAPGRLDAELINARIKVASNFTFAIDTSDEVSAYRGSVAAASVRTMLSTVTATTDTDAFQSTVNATLASLSPGVDTAAYRVTLSDESVQLVGVAPELPSFT